MREELLHNYYRFICPIVKTHLSKVFYGTDSINVTPKEDLIKFIRRDYERIYNKEACTLYGIRLVDFGKFEKYAHALAGSTILVCGIAIVFLGL